MTARPSFIKRAAQRFLNLNPTRPTVPNPPAFVLPQTALTTHQPVPAKDRTIHSKFAAFANGEFIPVARLGEPVVVVKRTPTWRAEHLPTDPDDINHARHQLERIVALARRVG